MIYVTCGHEEGIGLEVFLKSVSLLSTKHQNKITLLTNKSFFEQELSRLKIKNCEFKVMLVEPRENPTIDTIIHALGILASNDILITLPSTKDQFKLDGKSYSGHTSFFRKYFKSSNIVMTFTRGEEHLLLLTDHIPLSNVSGKLNDENEILNKIDTALKGINNFSKIKKVYISGINPHSGENGTLGTEDAIISKVVSKLSVDCEGPISGDTMHFLLKDNTLGVYAYHDQALSYFKSKFSVYGMNITHGLPFLRLSPDFGTASHLKGTREAHYGGMIELLKFALKQS